MNNRYLTINTVEKYRIEIINKEIFEKAFNTYWLDRDIFKTKKIGFYKHLVLMANENGFIENEVERFGICIRIESETRNIY